MVYGTYNELVTGENLNQLTSLGGLTLYQQNNKGTTTGVLSHCSFAFDVVTPIDNTLMELRVLHGSRATRYVFLITTMWGPPVMFVGL